MATYNETNPTVPATHEVDLDHDQSTVHSPTAELQHEKYNEPGVAGTTGTTTTGTGRPKKQGKITQLMSLCSDNPIVTYLLRFWQFAFAVVALGCAANSLAKFYRSDTRMRLTSFTAALTLVYLFFVFLLAFCYNSLLIAGPLLIMEIILTILWLCSFIGGTARFAGVSCKKTYQGYGNYYSAEAPYNNGGYATQINQYSSDGRLHGCRTGKAACAFAAISFLLFAISTLLLFFNVVKPLLARKKSALFAPGNRSGVRLNKNGLAFSKYYDVDNELYGEGAGAGAGVNDVENNAAYGHAHTASGATYGDAGYGNTGTGATGTVPETTGTGAGYGSGTAGTGTTGNATGNRVDPVTGDVSAGYRL